MNRGLQTGFLATCARAGIRTVAREKDPSSLLSIAMAYLTWSELRMQEVVGLLLVCTSPGAVIDVLASRLGLIPLRAVQVARFLRFTDARFNGMDFDVVGAGAEDILKAIVGPNGSLQDLQDVLVPFLRAGDTGNIIERLEQLGLEPLKLTSLEHFCCELRKILTGHDHEFRPRGGFLELWRQTRMLEARLWQHVDVFKRRKLQHRETV